MAAVLLLMVAVSFRPVAGLCWQYADSQYCLQTCVSEVLLLTLEQVMAAEHAGLIENSPLTQC